MVQAGVLALAGACLLSCQGRQEAFHCQVIEVEGGYGYLITRPPADTIICQPFIPAVPGQKAFRTAADAKAAGKAVCAKLRAGHPPTLTRKELDSLGIKKP